MSHDRLDALIADLAAQLRAEPSERRRLEIARAILQAANHFGDGQPRRTAAWYLPWYPPWYHRGRDTGGTPAEPPDGAGAPP